MRRDGLLAPGIVLGVGLVQTWRQHVLPAEQRVVREREGGHVYVQLVLPGFFTWKKKGPWLISWSTRHVGNLAPGPLPGKGNENEVSHVGSERHAWPLTSCYLILV